MRVADDMRPTGVATKSAPRTDGGNDLVSDGLMHDIRDAVSTVSAASMLLRARETDAGTATILQALDAAVRRLDTLTHALAQRGREGAQPALAPVSLAEFARELEAVATVRADAQGVAARVMRAPGLPDTARFDRPAVSRILDNLLANAIEALSRASGEAPGVTVEIGHEGGDLQIDVTDNGPGLGLDPERWFAAGETGSGRAGRGLGLWVARQTAAALGGRLSGRTLGHGGARFRLTVPMDAERGAGTDTPNVEPRTTGPCVLVVDTNPVERELLRALLEDAGALTLVAGNAGAALNVLRARAVDIALIDRTAAGAVIEAFRTASPDTSIVVIGAEGDDPAADHAISAPLDPAELADLVTGWLARAD